MVLFVLGVDGLDLLTDEVHLVLEFLHLAIHLVDEAVALLAAGIQEAEVVLVSLNLLFDGLVLTEQAGALMFKSLYSLSSTAWYSW